MSVAQWFTVPARPGSPGGGGAPGRGRGGLPLSHPPLHPQLPLSPAPSAVRTRARTQTNAQTQRKTHTSTPTPQSTAAQDSSPTLKIHPPARSTTSSTTGVTRPHRSRPHGSLKTPSPRGVGVGRARISEEVLYLLYYTHLQVESHLRMQLIIVSKLLHSLYTCHRLV